jgi:hypothetical protein
MHIYGKEIISITKSESTTERTNQKALSRKQVSDRRLVRKDFTHQARRLLRDNLRTKREDCEEIVSVSSLRLVGK